MSVISPIDVDATRDAFVSAEPFPHFVIEPFLDPDFAREVAGAYPSVEQARSMGREFTRLYERGKIQVTDESAFPDPVLRLSDALASPDFLETLSQITGIETLKADPSHNGGGMHVTGRSGRLDVHVDFNLLHDEGLHRRLNILVFLNPEWDRRWGGILELWDSDVRHCVHSIVPTFNKCVVFETSEISFHGVTPVRCPANRARQSFAGYYYTEQAPENWAGYEHSTIFKSRPNEQLRNRVLIPVEEFGERLITGARAVKRGAASALGLRKNAD